MAMGLCEASSGVDFPADQTRCGASEFVVVGDPLGTASRRRPSPIERGFGAAESVSSLLVKAMWEPPVRIELT
jgi:hypothetical protein